MKYMTNTNLNNPGTTPTVKRRTKMKMMPTILVAGSLGVLGIAANAAESRWGDRFVTAPKTSLPGFVEKNADYYSFSYRFDSLPPDTAIRISGEFPKCRYSSFSLYKNGNILKDADTSKDATLVDADIEPDNGSINPFRPHTDRDAENRSFSFLITINSKKASEWTSNLITLVPVNKNEACSLIYRIYLADNREEYMDPPKIEFFDLNTGVASDGPRGLINFPNVFKGRYGTPSDSPPLPEIPNLENPAPYSDIRGFSSDENSGLFSDQRYVYLTLKKTRGQEVALLQWRLPKFTDVRNPETPSFNGNEEVRYHSVSTYKNNTFLIDSLADYQLKVDENNIVTLVLASSGLRDKYEAMGVNFMEWNEQNIRVLFRQKGIAPSFMWSYDKVPGFSWKYRPWLQYADLYIGDYAPTGIYLDESVILQLGIE